MAESSSRATWCHRGQGRRSGREDLGSEMDSVEVTETSQEDGG
jgi:hypothetical protein